MTKQKVIAYITHNHQLLVLTHPQFPEIGLQVPGGTVENTTDLESEVLREVFEETDRTQLHYSPI